MLQQRKFTLSQLDASPDELTPGWYRKVQVWIAPKHLWPNPASACFFYSKEPTAPIYSARPHLLGLPMEKTKKELRVEEKERISRTENPRWDQQSAYRLTSDALWLGREVDDQFLQRMVRVEFQGKDGKWHKAYSVRQGRESFPVSFNKKKGTKLYFTNPSRIRDDLKYVKPDDRSLN